MEDFSARRLKPIAKKPHNFALHMTMSNEQKPKQNISPYLFGTEMVSNFSSLIVEFIRIDLFPYLFSLIYFPMQQPYNKT